MDRYRTTRELERVRQSVEEQLRRAIRANGIRSAKQRREAYEAGARVPLTAFAGLPREALRTGRRT